MGKVLLTSSDPCEMSLNDFCIGIASASAVGLDISHKAFWDRFRDPMSGMASSGTMLNMSVSAKFQGAGGQLAAALFAIVPILSDSAGFVQSKRC